MAVSRWPIESLGLLREGETSGARRLPSRRPTSRFVNSIRAGLNEGGRKNNAQWTTGYKSPNCFWKAPTEVATQSDEVGRYLVNLQSAGD
jgi:hypothetical protein